VASIEDHFFAEIVELERSHQMWAFLRSHYEPIGQSTFLVAIHQEQLLHQGDDIVDAFLINFLLIGVRLTLLILSYLLPLASHARIKRLRDEFGPVRAQLFAHHPCVSLMDALAEVHNKETHLQDVGLLRISLVLDARFLVARPATPVPPACSLVALSATRGASTSFHYDHCGQNGSVDAFC
jgi:hypothetical protein